MTEATRNLLERHFDTAFAAPDGVARLRELILTLAMQGNLVEQDPNDPPASELLKEIETDKKRQVKTGKIKKPKPLPPIKPEEVPYELPQGWEWVRLGEITEYNGRRKISGNEIAPDTWLLDLEDIEKSTSRILNRAKFLERQSKSTKSTFQQGDVLYGKLRPYLDKVVVADMDGVCTTEIVPIVPLRGINSEFLRWLLKRPAFLAHVNSLMYGVKMPRLGTDDAVMSIHPFPPFPEQHRIVARIDQLMARCDALARLRKEREEKRLAVHAAAIKQLLDAPDGSAWDFIQQHFGELHTVKENVAEMRKAILQLAVMGRLVPQDANDPPASELLKQIEVEKQRLVKAGKIKKPKPLPPIKPEEVPYELPQGWEWVRLGALGLVGSSGRVHQRDWRDEGVPFYRAREIVKLSKLGFVKNELFVSEKHYRTLAKDGLTPEVHDLMITGVGTIGIPYIVKETDRFYFKDASVLIFKNYYRLYAPFLFWFFKSPLWIARIHDGSMGTTVHTLTIGRANEILMPLPPLPEQHRIVACIDQLMALCDTLDQQIDDATGKQTELLNAVMAHV